MKHHIISILLLLACLVPANAQEVISTSKNIDGGTTAESTQNNAPKGNIQIAIPEPSIDTTTVKAPRNAGRTTDGGTLNPVDGGQDPLHLPSLTNQGKMPPMTYGRYGWGWPVWYCGGFGCWDLHPGLNVSLGASVFSTFGSGNTWSGAGFSQNISMMYATSLSKKLSLAIGGYLTNTSWAHDSYRDAGLTAVLDYRFNDQWSAYLYAQKSLVDNMKMPYPLYDMNDIGDRIGVGVQYNVTPKFSLGLSFEQRFDNSDHLMPTMPRNNLDMKDHPMPVK